MVLALLLKGMRLGLDTSIFIVQLIDLRGPRNGRSTRGGRLATKFLQTPVSICSLSMLHVMIHIRCGIFC
jgi:hypothetical protein